MIKMSLATAAQILSATINTDKNDLQFVGISTDTRTLQPGNLFVALQGENYDAHNFIDEAKQKGAIAALVQHPINASLPQLIVPDTLAALGKLAKAWREQFTLPVIALTGSNGKTTTKNMIAAIFLQANQNQADAVLFTQGNFNNAIGMPLTLSRLAPTHRHAVIEMGMNHFGELEYLSKLVEPTTALITNVATAHLEGVGGTIEGVAKAKGEIFLGLQNNGVAIINADENFANYYRELIGHHRYITFGLKNDSADVKGELLPNINAEISQRQTLFRLTYQSQSVDILLNLPGEHNVMNALAASAAAIANGVSLSDIKIALEKIQSAPGRLQLKMGQQGLRIIDDTYNANPASLRAAMHTLVKHTGTKILVMGDMRELGPDGEKLHFESGQLAHQLGINYLYATGTLSKAAVAAFGENAFHFPDHLSLINALKQYANENVVMLVKGSRSMRMEQVVQAFMSQVTTV